MFENVRFSGILFLFGVTSFASQIEPVKNVSKSKIVLDVTTEKI